MISEKKEFGKRNGNLNIRIKIYQRKNILETT